MSQTSKTKPRRLKKSKQPQTTSQKLQKEEINIAKKIKVLELATNYASASLTSLAQSGSLNSHPHHTRTHTQHSNASNIGKNNAHNSPTLYNPNLTTISNIPPKNILNNFGKIQNTSRAYAQKGVCATCKTNKRKTNRE